MKALAEQTEKVGIGSAKNDFAPIEVTLGEKTENIRSLVVGENVSSLEPTTAVKKKVRIVKKIVKKKVIKKVPKRGSVATNCNHLEKVAISNPNDNVPMEIEAVSVEIEKPKVVVDDSRKADNMEDFEISEEGKGVHLVENLDSCRDECEMSGLVTASLLGEQNQVELLGREHDINMDIEHEGEEDVKEQCEKSSQMDGGVSKGTQEEISVKEQVEKSECVGVKLEVGSSNDVKVEEGGKELVAKREDMDLKLTDAFEGREGVKELVENGETDGVRVEALSGEMGTSGRQMRQRTDIFIHGLDKETKEEDIRNVFEEAGKVIQVRIIMNRKTGKGRGFGFIRYASAADARSALTKYSSVEICGRPCRTAAVEGNDTILINNIDKRWNREDVVALLQDIGIKKIARVSVVADPHNTELNRGFAFLELETKKDAQIAYHKLQNKNVVGKHSKIKVAWAESVIDPDEEGMLNIKSVYAEPIPSSWDEDEVKDHFKIFGEIESIALAKNLRSTKRSDFAFINYKSCEAALLCIEAFSQQSTNDNGAKAHLKVSLAKSVPKGKQIKTISESAVTKLSKVKQKANQAVFKPHKPRNTRISSVSRHEGARTDTGSSTTAELVQILREQASWKLSGSGSITGAITGHHQPSPGGNRPFPELGSESLYLDARAYHQTPLEIHNAANPRSIGSGVAMTTFPRYSQLPINHTSGSFNGVKANPMYLQTRDQATYHGSMSAYRRLH